MGNRFPIALTMAFATLAFHETMSASSTKNATPTPEKKAA
jgi:hypothetical protein